LLQRAGQATAPITEELCGPALGFMRGATYTSSVHTLTKGDRLLLFTDGWIEEPNATGEEFGTARLLEALARHQETPIDQVLKLIAAEIAKFSGKTTRSDDLCGVLVGI
jgi:sigma-B regulation protein RsbU (phosphoserine phosphatase)